MFKQGSFSDEIYSSMETNLKAQASEKSYGLSKIAKAIDCLNTASEIFDDAGLFVEADELISVIQSFAELAPAAMPEFTTMPENWQDKSQQIPEMYNGEIVRMDASGRKYIINPGTLTPKYLPEGKAKPGMSHQDVERLQLSLNKVISGFQGQKPGTLIPDQKYGPATKAAFDWYCKTTNKNPAQATASLLGMTNANETSSKL